MPSITTWTAGLALLAAALPTAFQPARPGTARPPPAGSARPATAPRAPQSSRPWQWPLRPAPEVVRAFEPPADPWSAGHRGVDLAARAGQPVYAPARGHVSFAGRIARTNVVAISHGALRTTYLPVRPTVRPGQPVTASTKIGTIERRPAHCGHRTCLHWGLLRDATYLDPLTLIRLRIRLLPYWPEAPDLREDR